jgi:uncharacterized repeat protein (TIGR01451 family)
LFCSTLEKIQARYLAICLLLVIGLFASRVFAAVPAGTVITNTVTLNYSIGGVPAVANSNTASIVVGELINLTLTVQDAAPVSVNSPDVNRAITVLLTNTGNGSEAFNLARNNALVGDQFNPTNGAVGAIFFENGLQPGFQASGPNADTLYVPGVNDPVLAADETRVIYVVSNIPAGVALGGLGNVGITASSLTPGASGAVPGTALPGLGTGGVVAVVGGSRAISTVVGSYVVSGFAVAVAKSIVLVKDPKGGALIMPGSVLTYRVVLNVSGVGTANNLAFNDPLPIETTFVGGSIRVNGLVRTDAIDADNADYTPATRTVSARFGNTPSPATHTIDFQVTVN